MFFILDHPSPRSGSSNMAMAILNEATWLVFVRSRGVHRDML